MLANYTYTAQMTNPMMSFIVQAFYCFVFDKLLLY